jgi:hypothetical protein
VLKTKAAFGTEEAARKLLFLVAQAIARKWTRPIFIWPLILNQLAIRFEDRFSTLMLGAIYTANRCCWRMAAGSIVA